MQEPESPEKPDEPEGPQEPREPQSPETPGHPIFGAEFDEQFQSAHSPRKWKSCCLAPIIAVFAILIFTAVAGVFSGQGRYVQHSPQLANDPAMQARREVFTQFGKDYFAIARKADVYNEAAFGELDKMPKGNGSIKRVNDAFSKAGAANKKAAEEYNALRIPQGLLSREYIRKSIDSMSASYEARSRACNILANWNGDTNDKSVAGRYGNEVQKINSLTMDGLRYLGEAANDNGLSRDDLRRFLPSDIIRSWNVETMRE